MACIHLSCCNTAGAILNQAGFSSPRYADDFRCIGPACEDTCCQGWKVAIDEATYRRYEDLPRSPLRTLIHENLERAPNTGKTASPFAIIRMTPANQCPMLSEERLCQIQSAYGASFLSHACANLPAHHSSPPRRPPRGAHALLPGSGASGASPSQSARNLRRLRRRNHRQVPSDR